MKKNISVSILDAKNIPDFLNNINKVKKMINEIGISDNFFNTIIHFDVMDNKFVKNTGIDLKWIKTAKNLGFYADTHLMVENPIGDKYVDTAIEYGTDDITIHYEIKNFDVVIKYLFSKKLELQKLYKRILNIGVSVKPDTKTDGLEKYKDMFSKILVMSVEPGYGGQKYIEKVSEKIKDIKRIFKDKIIEIDGGINSDTIEEPLRLGVNEFVIGSYLSKEDELDKLFDKFMILNSIKQIEELQKNGNLKLDNVILNIKPGGYGQNDILLGISVPVIRSLVNKMYKIVNFNVLDFFINSKYHDYRRFAIYCLSKKVEVYKKKNDIESIFSVIDFMEKNLSGINNWDLTDDVGPNVLGEFLILVDEKNRNKKLLEFINSDRMWKKRIGIVSLLTLVRNGYVEYVLDICNINIYEEFHLYQKATGWVLRELYKKEPTLIVEFLNKKNKVEKLPSILMSYACEKMSKREKEIARAIN